MRITVDIEVFEFPDKVTPELEEWIYRTGLSCTQFENGWSVQSPQRHIFVKPGDRVFTNDVLLAVYKDGKLL